MGDGLSGFGGGTQRPISRETSPDGQWRASIKDNNVVYSTSGDRVRADRNVGADRLLRFYERGNAFVSGPKRLLLPVA